uniref:Uncharacterized protein n=1 Tax=Arundo donax TaxID=35708 RepID=A0A0A9DTJ2_ARUDO
MVAMVVQVCHQIQPHHKHLQFKMHIDQAFCYCFS